MKISIISFTENGKILSEKLKEKLAEQEIYLFTKYSAFSNENKKVSFVECSINDWTKEQMRQKNALVFIGACGIAVRAIAPHIVSKLQDSPVLVLDEKGHYVIPILSGHLGGANELAHLIGENLGAKPVITTATDLNHKFAIDFFAKRNQLSIRNKDGIAKISAKILAGESIKISVENGHLNYKERLPEQLYLVSYPPNEMVDIVVTSEKKPFDAGIILQAKEYVIGAGCRKGKEARKLEAFIKKHLVETEIEENQILALASIDVKCEEPCMLAWSKKKNIPFLTYSNKELQMVIGKFQESEFVKHQVGIGNVCERAALKAAGVDSELVYQKHAEDGMTIAIAKRKWSVIFDEE